MSFVAVAACAVSDRLAGEQQIEALEKFGDAVGIHLELIAGAERGQDLRASSVTRLCPAMGPARR